MKQFGLLGFFGRWLAALLLVGLSFNPSGYSFFHWALQQWPITEQDMLPLKALAGLMLIIGYVIFLRATFRSIGILGIVLVVAVLASLVWLFVDLNWLVLESSEVISWICVLILSTILAVGISWSHIRRRLTGQLDADDVDE